MTRGRHSITMLDMLKKSVKRLIWIVFLGFSLTSVNGCSNAPSSYDRIDRPTPIFYRGNYISSYDVSYGDHNRQELDIHLRGEWADSDDRMNLRMVGDQPPTVVFIHGGGWYISDKREWEHFISPFLQAGYNVVNLNYRLRQGIAPAIEDVSLALTYLHETNETLRLDLDRVLLVGASAGGFMAMFHGAAANAEENPFPFPASIRIAGVVNIVGGGTECFALYEMLIQHENPFWQRVGRALVKEDGDVEALMEEVCPSQYFDAGDPPVFLAHGERDQFGPPAQYEEIEAQLRSHGTTVERVGYPDSGHTFIQHDWRDLFPRLIDFIDVHAAK